MPVLRDWELALDADKVLWGQGADPAIIRARRPRLAALAEAVIEEGRPLLAPAILYRRIPVVGLRHERLLLAGGGVLLGPLIAGHLAVASEVIVAVCTVGDGLAQTISERFETEPRARSGAGGLGGGGRSVSRGRVPAIRGTGAGRGAAGQHPTQPGHDWQASGGRPAKGRCLYYWIPSPLASASVLRAQ